MSEFSARVQSFMKKREARQALPKITLGFWCGNFLMALFSRTLTTSEGGLGIGAITSIGLAVVLSIYYFWRNSVLTKQLDELRNGMTDEDKVALLRQIVG